MAKTTRPETPNSNHFAGLCQSLALSAPEVIEFAGLCEKLTILGDGDALAVLNRESGKLLEHRQLRKIPRYNCTPMSLDVYAKGLAQAIKQVGKGSKALTPST